MKQRGIVRLEGTYDDVTFYKSNGDSLARKKGGVSRERLLTDPAFERQRANFNEFGGSAKLAKALREAILNGLVRFNDATGNRNLTGLMKSVVSQGQGTFGTRSFDLVANSHLLKAYDFKNKDPLSAVCKAPYSVSSVAARNEATLTVPDFNTKSLLFGPVGCTHFRLILSIGTLSEYQHDPDLGYQPVNLAENQLHEMVSTPLIPISGMVGSVTTLTAALPNSPTISANTALIVAVGIEFSQNLNGSDYLLHDGKALRIVDVF